MWLAKVSSGIDENLFASYFCWIAGNSHTWVLEELSGGHVILTAVPRTGDVVVLESAVDYHRVNIAEDYEQILIKFLVGRTRSKGLR